MKSGRAAAALLAILLCPAPLATAGPLATDRAPHVAQAQPGNGKNPGEREKALKVEQERLLALRKEVNEKIAKYEKLLGQVEQKQSQGRAEEKAKAEQIVKIYEGMAPEDAAVRLGALDDGMAAAILSAMKSRKASAILSAMDPKRVANLTLKMAAGVKKFPAE